jgi:BioD-like phosphotransacetylase family protein
MSAHAFADDKIRTRLESKGEPILAEPGKQILLETATLQLEARVIDMEYGEGAAPDQSYFQRLTMELAVWPK